MKEPILTIPTVGTRREFVVGLLAFAAIGAGCGNRVVTGKPLPDPKDLIFLSGSVTFPGKPLLVEFWATWCGPCRSTIPHLNSLYQSLGRDIQFVGVTNETLVAINKFRSKTPIHYPIARDPSSTYHQALNVRGIPSAFLADSKGLIVWSGHPSRLTSTILRKAL